MTTGKVRSWLYGATFILLTACVLADQGDEDPKPLKLPRCAQIQKPDADFLDQLEGVEMKIFDSLCKIQALEARLILRDQNKAKGSMIKTYQPIDYNAYFKQQKEVLNELNDTLLKVVRESKKFADPETPDSRSKSQSSHATNKVSDVELLKQ